MGNPLDQTKVGISLAGVTVDNETEDGTAISMIGLSHVMGVAEIVASAGAGTIAMQYSTDGSTWNTLTGASWVVDSESAGQVRAVYVTTGAIDAGTVFSFRWTATESGVGPFIASGFFVGATPSEVLSTAASRGVTSFVQIG